MSRPATSSNALERPPLAQRIFIKLCGFIDPADANAAAGLDIDALGVVLAADARVQLTNDQIRAILRELRETAIVSVAVVGPMATDDCRRVLELGFDALQWVVPADAAIDHPLLSGVLDGRPVIPVFFDGEAVESRIRSLSLGQSLPASAIAQTVCLDGPRGGGRGERPDWERAARLASELPLMLAGGLRCENVAQAIGQVRPRAVDVSSGIEVPGGRKSRQAMAAFVAAVRTLC